jgi:hypothetical protein
MYDSIHQALKSCCPQFTSTRAFSFNCKFVIGGVLMHESSMHVWGAMCECVCTCVFIVISNHRTKKKGNEVEFSQC